jgi:hypothetical protein
MWANRALALAMLGKMDHPSQAMAQFRKAAEIDPEGLYGKLAASQLRVGVALIK